MGGGERRPRPAPALLEPDESALARAVGLAEGLGRPGLGLVDPVTAGSSRRSRPCCPARPPDWGRVLKLAETLAGRDGEERFAAAGDAVLRFVSAELDRDRGNRSRALRRSWRCV